MIGPGARRALLFITIGQATLLTNAEAQTKAAQDTATKKHVVHRKSLRRAAAPGSPATTKQPATGVAAAAGAAVPATSIAANPIAANPIAANPIDVSPIIVTGTRNIGTLARDSTSPIDVISNAALTRSGQPNLAQQLVTTDPSVDIQGYGLDTAALTTSIRLRGLSPNEVLVLVDGVRRHETANISADAGPEQGATPVDINMIPAAAIDHIELLKDGAAAQYGSDAIAGVVNIITKKTSTGGSATAESGADAYTGQGWQYQLDADKGASFGDNGYIHLGGQVYHTDHFVSDTADDRSIGGNFPANSNQTNSLPEETRETFSIAAGATVAPDTLGGIDAYSFITYGHRHAEAYENYRLPDVLPQVFPAGFDPLETDEENDYAATLGLKAGDIAGFHASLSTTYGENDVRIGNKNTANPTLYQQGDAAYGLAPGYTPTTVMAQGQYNAQWTNDLDFTRLFHVYNRPLNLAFGFEHRLDMYELTAGDPASYVLGGTQGFAGLLPASAGMWNRDVYAGYVDLDVRPVPKLDVDLAGRFEHYTDFGNTENGKLSSRYDFTKWIAARGTISNGFRAPTLAEEHFSALNVSPTGASGDLAANSTAARSIGAVPLKPERSTNASAGLVLQPLPALSITLDVYQINIRDRIVGAGGVNGQAALNAIADTGASLPAGITLNDVSAYYFANGASTRTQGLDLDATYLSDLERYGTITYTAGLDLNRTRVTHIGTDAFGNPFLNAQGVGYLTTAFPRSKLILDALWRYQRWDVNLRQTRYGQTTDNLTYEDQAPASLQYSVTQFYQFHDAPRWLTDLEVGYKLSRRWHVAVGADNIFNILPSKAPPDVSYLGVSYYDNEAAQIPISGGFYYGRLNYTF
jgi:iron complex outermembrane receptor protein